MSKRRDVLRGLAAIVPVSVWGVRSARAIPGESAGNCVGPQRGENGLCPSGYYAVDDYSYCRPEHNPCPDLPNMTSKKYGKLNALCCAKPTKHGKAQWGCADTDTDRTYHVCRPLGKTWQKRLRPAPETEEREAAVPCDDQQPLSESNMRDQYIRERPARVSFASDLGYVVGEEGIARGADGGWVDVRPICG